MKKLLTFQDVQDKVSPFIALFVKKAEYQSVDYPNLSGNLAYAKICESHPVLVHTVFHGSPFGFIPWAITSPRNFFNSEFTKDRIETAIFHHTLHKIPIIKNIISIFNSRPNENYSQIEQKMLDNTYTDFIVFPATMLPAETPI